MTAHDPFDLDAQAQAEQDAQAKSKRAMQQEIEDIKWLMSNKRGRRYLYGVLERAGVMQLSFNTNAMMMSFNEGRRNEGLATLAKILAHCPDQYVSMLKENSENA